MRFYTQQHRFYCGVDLHARSMYLCILDADGCLALRAGGTLVIERTEVNFKALKLLLRSPLVPSALRIRRSPRS